MFEVAIPARCRIAAPQFLRSPPSGLLSVNVFYCTKKPSLTMSNCRSIKVSVINPQTSSASCLTAQSSSKVSNSDTRNLKSQQRKRPDSEAWDADRQERADLTEYMDSRDMVYIFPFLQLPLELRLKIYSYLLPSRVHTIVTQHPYNGFLYSAGSIPQGSTQTFYPFGADPPKASYTTYEVLNSNFRAESPAPGIFPHILRVCKQFKEEAEPVLYGSNGTIFDFGAHLEALIAFFGDRSELSRRSVRTVRIASEIPVELAKEGAVSPRSVYPKWDHLCRYLKEALVDLRTLDLTVWSSNGSLHSFPSPANSFGLSLLSSTTTEEEQTLTMQNHLAAQWRDWEWTRDLLSMAPLRKAKVTWWGSGQEFSSFDAWMAGRMAGDELFKERMVTEKVVVEGWIVLGGVAA